MSTIDKSDELNKKIEKYLEYKEEFDKLKALESELRLEVSNAIKEIMLADKTFDTESKKIFINTENYSVKGEIPTNLNFEKEERNRLIDLLDLSIIDSSSGYDEDEISCFDFKVEINESRYKKFKKEKGKDFLETNFFKFIVEKDGTPQLKIKKL